LYSAINGTRDEDAQKQQEIDQAWRDAIAGREPAKSVVNAQNSTRAAMVNRISPNYEGNVIINFFLDGLKVEGHQAQYNSDEFKRIALPQSRSKAQFNAMQPTSMMMPLLPETRQIINGGDKGQQKGKGFGILDNRIDFG